MKKVILCLSLALGSIFCGMTVTAEKIAMPVTGWEESFWQYQDGTEGLTENGTGVEATGDAKWVQKGSGALHVWCEASKANLNSQAVQRIPELASGGEYRLSGKMYISSNSWGYGLYIGSTRLTMIRNIVTYGEWCDLDYTFTYNGTETDFKVQVAQAGHLYADSLSLKKVVGKDADGNTVYGGELLKNGDFEADFAAPEDVKNVSCEAYSSAVELRWTLPADGADKIMVFADGELLAETDGGSTAVIVDGLENGREYKFVIKTQSKKGVMSQGVEISAMPVVRLPLPQVIKDDRQNRIIGLTNEMEYSTDNGASWTRYDGGEPPVFPGKVTVLVRMYSADGSAQAPELALFFTEDAEQDGKIKLTDAKIIGNEYTVSGVIEGGAGADVTMTMIKKGADRRDLSQILALRQTKSKQDGGFSFTGNIADERSGAANDGEYVLYVYSADFGEISKGGMTFVNSKTRADALDALWESENPSELLKTGSQYYDAYVCMGLPAADYNQDGIMSKAAADFVKIRSTMDKTQGEQALREALVKALVMNLLKESNADTAYRVLTDYNDVLKLSYGGVDFGTAKDESISWICSFMAGKEYNKPEDIDGNYAKACALMLINKATYGSIAGIIAEHETTLGIDSAAYKRYKALSGSNDEKVYISKKLVLAAASSPFNSTEDIDRAISKAAADYKPTQGGGGGGTGGGGTTSNGSFSVPPSKTDTTPVAGNKIFNDIANAAWAEKAINYLYSRGIISGYGEGVFAPGREITREEFVAVLVRAFDIKENASDVGFADINADKWYHKAVCSAANAGIVSGVAQNEFGVGRSITRQDIAVMLYRCLDLQTKPEFDAECFSDIGSVSEYAKEAVSAMKSLGYISGYEDASFKPEKTATRAEASQILYLILTDERNAK